MFAQPERRRISVLSYSPEDFIDRVELTDEQVKAEYEKRIKDYSTPVPAYKFIAPRILSGVPRTDDNKHWTMDILTDHESELQLRAKYPQWNGVHTLVPQPYTFARLLAKIAYCRAVAEYGIDGFTPLALDVILGRSDDYFLTVGGSLESQPAAPGGDHVLDLSLLFRSPRIAHLIVDVRLFSQIVSPAYRVVAGEVNLDNPKHAAVLSRHQGDGKLVTAPKSADIA